MIALLSNVTVESLALRLKQDVFTAPGFDTWRAELLNPASAVWRDEIKTVYVLLHGPALFPQGLDEDFVRVLSEPLEILAQAREAHKEKVFVVSTLDLPSPPSLPLAGKNFAARAAAWWREKLEDMDAPLLDAAELAAEAGRERFYNAKTWYFGSLPFSQQGEALLAREILRAEGAVRGERKKCLVLDLDGTLWGGVIGEDGVEGISLASTGMGSQYWDVQHAVKALAGQGILLAVASKNDAEDALLPFKKHPHMILREDDFVRFEIGWNPKTESLRTIAQGLNIGLDSLVFVDDNPVEREAVRAFLPQVAVPDFPKDTSKLPAFMAEVARTYFTTLRTGEEDRKKTAMYRAELRREKERGARLSLDDYLASLEMKLDLHRLRQDEIPRAAQLSQKTNQFNLTTRRCTEAGLAALMEDKNVRIWMAGLRDRFGDYGRVCLVAARLTGSSAAVETFLMSCRVMGRDVENAVLGGVERALAAEGVTEIHGSYRETKKNEPVRDFWTKMGYKPEGDAWVSRAPFVERSAWIELDGDGDDGGS
ncbi:MAG: HAD-IIIC family phosphatase [Synergistaceae bacterium]|jgi:FkbH-like protein|nr:HAD-IIIC family phosphatase [Synergistaceae bacterium]